jgi:hypothetical protein
VNLVKHASESTPATHAAQRCPAPDIYHRSIAGHLGRALSMLDAEITSPSRGSFDRTWWGWKFSDFSASRFQEGVFTLAWLVSSERAPPAARGSTRLLEQAAAAIRFWARLQHGDGSFDEAYPFERSLAATAFTSFYVGCGIERLAASLPSEARGEGLRTIERAARWLARHGEYHGILSNHLAAAAATLQVAGDLLGTDRFSSARNRYIGTIYANQDPDEGWLREYGGADPGYQSHAMFYLAEIWRRTQEAQLLESLRRATSFIAWFAHPDGTLGGEYASRGTKFAYPAAFEILAHVLPEAAGVAAHLRRCLANRRGVGPHQMDAWNMLPVLNNHLFAAEAARPLTSPPPLPWQQPGCSRVFTRAGIGAARAGQRVLIAGLSLGGVVKLWDAASGSLVYEDCGYALFSTGRPFCSQAYSLWTQEQAGEGNIHFHVVASFAAVPSMRLRPWRFLAFRTFMLTLGRLHIVARGLKQLLVALLIRRKSPHSARLQRSIEFDREGRLTITDRLIGLNGTPVAVDRHVAFHMGSARYADVCDWMGAQVPCRPPSMLDDTTAQRVTHLE